jgi:ornithine cyclodeaminase
MGVDFLYLSQEDVVKCGALDMAQTIACVEEATVMMYRKDALEADPVHLLWNGISGKRMAVHAAYLGKGKEIAGGKVIASNPDNPIQRGTPRASAVLVLNDPETGYPVAMMEGATISHMRTGALTGVGAKYLVTKPRQVIGIIGAGPIGRTSLMALREVLNEMGSVRVFDLVGQRAAAFKAEVEGDLGADIRVVGTAEEAVRGADIVVPATTVGPGEAYIEYEWLGPGCMLSDASIWDEKDEVIINADKIVLNNFWRLGFRHDRFASLIADDRVSREKIIHLGAVITGEAKGREREGEIILFCPRGMCLHDVCNGYRIYEAAKARGVGRVLTLWERPVWG